MKNIKRHSFVLLFITLLILFIILKDDYAQIIDAIIGMKYIFLLISILVIFLSWFFKTLSMYFIVREYNKKIKMSTIFKQAIITQFFNGITPFSTGGQPMEIYMLNKCGVSVAKASNIVLQNSMVYQVALVIYGIIALVVNANLNLFSSVEFLGYIVAFGFLMNTLVCIGFFVLSFSRKLSSTLLSIVLKIGTRLNLIKDKEKFDKEYSRRLEEFHESGRVYRSNKPLFIKGVLLNFVALTMIYITPYFLIKGMGIESIPVYLTIVTSAYVLLVGSFVPIPGGSGGIEYAFMCFFGVFVKDVSLSALLIVWRFVTYYFGMILGGIIFSFYKGSD